MGGQACVLYGAAEFSRDIDIAVLAETENLARLREALEELQAQRIAVPPFEARYLEMGLAVHFRCGHPEAARMRVDVMSRMRGMPGFSKLWRRRTTFEISGAAIEVMSLPDLVNSKKTQRAKDWPMLTRLVEANYFVNRADPTPQQIEFWFRELRTPVLLIELAQRFPEQCGKLTPTRPLIGFAAEGNKSKLRTALDQEEAREREEDRKYWAPLKEELRRLRHRRE